MINVNYTKYKLTDENIEMAEVTLYRIEALRDFGSVKAGAANSVRTVDGVMSARPCHCLDEGCAGWQMDLRPIDKKG